MSDRKYRQRGYQDSDRDRERHEKKPVPREERIGPRMLAMPGKRMVIRCAGCGTVLAADMDTTGKCPRCGYELHSCKQCVFFDPSARFECLKPITERIAKKDARNECTFYRPRTTVERETSSPKPTDARAAFENLFKK
jgi:predicted RNA-binding Zn-ribbon protein involved in translation (DUF1610 family)